ncbi:hypothetical protein CRENBAI_018956 [Crenichthys baileyi]|uniref:Uncharacterized protein n=1 Tax=Crenichthys baileyi TaxID=28760 RepID=A0AAV9SBH0_9TELE
MGNVLKVDQDFAGNTIENKSIQKERQMQLAQQLLQQLSELSEVELWRVQCCLSQTLLPKFPPIPRHCLHCADALKTAKTMILCYHEDGALSVLATALNLMSPEHPAFNHIMSPTRTKSVRTPVFELVSLPELKMAPDFVRTLRRRLISRIQRPDSVLDALQSNRILNPANRKAVNIYALNKHKNRALMDLILMKGHEAQVGLLQILSQSEPFMLEELNNDLIREKALTEQEISEDSSSIRKDKNGLLAAFGHVFDMNNSVFRLSCKTAGVYSCPFTGLVLDGFGDVLYEMVPWNVDFLSSKGLRPAGPLFRFTLLTGTFDKLHLPHCQLLQDKGKTSLSVAHVTGDYLDFIPGQVTHSHVIIKINGFSCFGLVTSAGSSQAIAGLVLLFFQPFNLSTFVVLLPRNMCLTQVRKEFRRRIGAEYLEQIPDCELISNQMYKLTGEPVTIIQPKISKFLNFTDYDNFLPSFEVRVSPDVTTMTLKLTQHVVMSRVIGWFFSSADCEVWSRVVKLSGTGQSSESANVSMQLFKILIHLKSQDLKTFQHLLTL